MHAKFPDLAGRFLDRYGQAYALPRFMRYNGLNLDRSHSQRTTLYYSLRRDGIFPRCIAKESGQVKYSRALGGAYTRFYIPLNMFKICRQTVKEIERAKIFFDTHNRKQIEGKVAMISNDLEVFDVFRRKRVCFTSR